MIEDAYSFLVIKGTYTLSYCDCSHLKV